MRNEETEAGDVYDEIPLGPKIIRRRLVGGGGLDYYRVMHTYFRVIISDCCFFSLLSKIKS